MQVFFDDVPNRDAGVFNDALDRDARPVTVPHTIKFVDERSPRGEDNDIVNGLLSTASRRSCGTTWENYYRYDPEQAASGECG